ncbi:hypothetical protein K490DRAFT_63986 [Saccharata proteae CBS 121410]|uniref:Myosin class II heavy chain n=1 Tax=Saccharata proteae CBS 121410 TaxID=1314787 RepID=A0A6A5YBA1_9PEZI|nr:hypothetical protein K490DRAFT_63986 [Saccharata proteae CBS 121410]
MQAQRITTPPPPSRSTSTPPLRLDHQGGLLPADHTIASSPAQTLWTAPSPTQTLGHSSPDLPPLPALPTLGGLPRTPSTVARAYPTDTDNSFYTASWGSPYQRPPPGFGDKLSAPRRSSALSSESVGEDDSPRFGLDHLIPSRLEEEDNSKPQFGLGHLLPSRLPQLLTPTRAGTSWLPSGREDTPQPPQLAESPTSKKLFFPREPTQDWIERFLAEQWQSEKASWWSDGSTEEESDEERISVLQGDQPKVKEKKRRTRKGHKSRQNNLTLKQQDFWAHFSEKGREKFDKMLASRFANPPAPLPKDPEPTLDSKSGSSPVNVEKPLPPPPPAEDMSAFAAALPANGTVGQFLKVDDSSSRASPAPRSKKRVLWKNRNIVISIPNDPRRGKEGGPPQPMTTEQMAARLREFEEAGYDTRGFEHWKQDGVDVTPYDSAQGRDIWPDAQEQQEWRSREGTTVHIPDREEWQRYVNFLTEQKLAALGVSLGGSEEPESGISRSGSAQFPGLTFSPPPGTSSATSAFGFNGPFALPAGPSPGIPGHMSRTSIASPISPFGNVRPSMHLHRHSTFTSPANIPLPAPTPPGLAGWSPQLVGQQGVVRGGSPALPANRSDLADMLSPASPFGAQPAQQYPFPQRDDAFAQMQRQQQQLQNTMLQQQQQQLLGARPTSTLAGLPEEGEVEGEDAVLATPPRSRNGPAPEILAPTPRGHSHNISENMERGISDAEYHLEREIDRQLDEDGEFGTGNRFGLQSPPSKPTLTNGNETMWQNGNGMHRPQPHERTHSLTQAQNYGPGNYNAHQAETHHVEDDARTNISEAETNPSLDGRNNHNARNGSIHHSREGSQFNNDRSAVSHTSQGSKSSLSKLNVEAKEFKFNPNASFSPTNFTFGGAGFSPAQQQQPQQQQERPPPSRSGGKVIHATAPSFVPSFKKFAALQPPQQPVQAPQAPQPFSGSFNFNMGGPSFKPDVPSLQPAIPSSSEAGPSPTVSAFPPEGSGRIFGSIRFKDAAEANKPASRSKAIPIVRPDTVQQQQQQQPVSDAETFDESGRAQQAEWRMKRARRQGDGGDDVPQFAIPTRIVPSNAPSPQPLGELFQPPNSKPDFKRSASPMPQGKENKSPERPASVVPDSKAGAEQQLQFPKAAPGAGDSQSNGATEAETETSTRKAHSSKGSLSATAKPFEFKPQTGIFDFGMHVTRPSGDGHQDPEQVREAMRQLSRSPAGTFRSDDGSYITALSSKKAQSGYPDEAESFDSRPTFKEIDEVMRQMHEAGSDFGVERNEVIWERSSPPPFEQQPTLRPSGQLRSNAPSPVSGHLYPAVASRSGSITGDPFSDGRAALAYDSPVHRLNERSDVPISDWDDDYSDNVDKIQARSRFFDNHVDSLIDNVLQSRLGPLERNIRVISDSLASMSQNRSSGRSGRSGHRSTSAEMESDADDEDDDLASNHRARSPGKNRKMEKIRNIVLEALASYQPPPPPPRSPMPPADPVDMGAFYQALADMKVSIMRSTSTSQLDDFREIMEEALQRQNMAIVEKREEASRSEAEARVKDLEMTLEEAGQRLEIAIESRKIAESNENDAQRKLLLAEEELSLLRATARDDSSRARAVSEECHDLRMKLATAEGSLASAESSGEELRRRLVTLETQNEALEATLNEYRLSSKKWHEEINEANEEKAALKHKWTEELTDSKDENNALRKANAMLELQAKRSSDENQALKNSLRTLEAQTEEALRVRESMRAKLEHLQKDMVSTASRMAEEKAVWRTNEEDHIKKGEILRARLEAEARTRERLERELERLEKQEREGMRLKVILEQTQHANKHMEQVINTLRLESLEHLKRAERFEREFQDARETGRAEVKRTRVLMEADLDAANNQVNIVRSELESEILRVRAELDNVRMDADTAKARHELLLESEADARRDALREAHESSARALQEQQRGYERALDDLQQRYEKRLEDQQDRYEKNIEELHRQGNRDLANAIEDRQRNEEHLNGVVGLEREKCMHYVQRIAHLEEKLEVATAAANAAAAAAAKKDNGNAKTGAGAREATTAIGDATGPQERGITIRALRESIAVLQEQLQERESRIEALQSRIDSTPADAADPDALRARDTEIAWLRELLGVRVDDLGDLVRVLGERDFDPEEVRDAAIRIRTGLAMEMAERERRGGAGGANGGLNGGVGGLKEGLAAGLSSFAAQAGPRAELLKGVWGRWGRGNSGNGGEAQGKGEMVRSLSKSSIKSSATASNTGTAANNTPRKTRQASKPLATTTAQHFLSGLMTPPHSSAAATRRAPRHGASASTFNSSRRWSSTTATTATDEEGTPRAKIRGRLGAVGKGKERGPRTPPLMRRGSYDDDAPEDNPAFGDFGDEGPGPGGFDVEEDASRGFSFRGDDGGVFGEGLGFATDARGRGVLMEEEEMEEEEEGEMRPFEPFGTGFGEGVGMRG